MAQFKVSAFDVCHVRFPVRLPGCEAALPTSSCGPRRRQELSGAVSRFLLHDTYLCVAALNLLFMDFASPQGLVVPVVRNVENMNFADIERAIYELGEKVRKVF